jgi:hypothetical protein
MNEYFKDSFVFLRKAASIIDDSIDFNQMIEASLHFALGIERILKGILWDINPIYVLNDPSFKNSAPILYHEKLYKVRSPEITDKPSSDVLTYRTSLLRVLAFSRVARQFSGLLFALSEYRDIIVHRPLAELEAKKLEKLLLYDFITVIKEFSEELNIPLVDLVGDSESKLRLLAPDFAVDIEQRMKDKIAFYKSEWELIKRNQAKMKALEPLLKKYSNEWNTDHMKCPACENTAIMSIEPDYEVMDGEAVITGIFPTGLRCSFCGFNASDYEEIDYLNLSDKLNWNLERLPDF